MQFVGRRVLTIDNYKRSVEVSAAVDFKLVGKGITLESIAVAL